MIARLMDDIDRLCAHGVSRSALVIRVHSHEDLRGLIVADGWPVVVTPIRLLGVTVRVDDSVQPGTAVVMQMDREG